MEISKAARNCVNGNIKNNNFRSLNITEGRLYMGQNVFIITMIIVNERDTVYAITSHNVRKVHTMSIESSKYVLDTISICNDID